MMTLDEAIKHAQENACGTDACADEHRQLATWLEKLRDYERGRFAHLPLSYRLVERTDLKAWAREIAARFGRPVYLTGSSLDLPQPRDVDVRVVLTDEEFSARWGEWSWLSNNDGYRSYACDMGKLSRHVSLFTMLNIDFQVQPHIVALKYAKGRRVRLDDVDGLEELL